MSATFPTKFSELSLSDPTITPSLYQTLKHLKKSTLSLHNRLSSILVDANYITDVVHSSFPKLPLIANERCGSWYIPPHLKVGSAYFKSTDGHYGAWDFSLRRLNLQVLELLGQNGGAVLVDSTRRGKRMPDALRRTVPVWVLVWNLVLFGDGHSNGESDDDIRGDPREWAFRLQHPGLEPSEVRLIESRVGDWVVGLKGLDLDLADLKSKLKRPIRLLWVVQGETIPELDDDYDAKTCNLLVLCSASRRVLGAEMSEDGYIQGAADDAEGWSGGLTSKIFWEHTEILMTAAEDDLPELILDLVEKHRMPNGGVEAVQIKPTGNIFVGVVQPMLRGVDVVSFDLVIDCNTKTDVSLPYTLNLGCRSGKLGSRDLREKMSLAIEAVTLLLTKRADSKILIVCENGKDLSIGVAVTILCLFFDDKGYLTPSKATFVDKTLVKKRLAWITSMKPDANPSRSTLQAVNSFLMS